MKKGFYFLLLISLFLPLLSTNAKAEEYLNYQEIVFDDDEAMLLKDFSTTNYATYYTKITKKCFSGWKLYVVNENENAEFVSETKLKIYNDGYSTIKHDITLKTSEETKFQVSASGSISTSVDGNIKKFKGSIDADIKASVTYTKTTTTSETYEFTIIVDPKTYVTIVTRGVGEVSNGVAKKYFCWIETKKGGWEIFTVKTEYYEIVKEKIR
ncbi:MAG TPA: hypothetical protein PLH02_00330 [Bacillota bacterium]|mgnify:CR=1 FL=1|nr:hypothetical protein [Bacillota bacterium]HPF42393.1 hypothetical protein [Bacillota bacterium]HPJ85394.1 hypothetical protein [Bacillota bacterium]HPQ61310.1 hypothetical protein [Bacillota bacterium]HRX91443.1 hypothetical protein [Candidatus Izemoplasmatales bacterium]